MAQVRKKTIKRPTFKDIIRGKFLIDDGALSVWRFIVFISFLLLIVITGSHYADSRTVYKVKLNDEIRELESAYTTQHKELMRFRMESVIVKRVAEDSLRLSETPPYKIIKQND